MRINLAPLSCGRRARQPVLDLLNSIKHEGLALDSIFDDPSDFRRSVYPHDLRGFDRAECRIQ